ncbi:nucleoside-diphosphate kinase [Egibacter rhizosphaerae]|uniref:Nucleoside diphosphate kinase n=1 Tax=Egibacter rhizosphaerae TaxID=1670831 RepID=A0A411YBV8_9ACTN|nr:nucleoside-diphosphate kinase [Egibacter rhizosphaerae]QBI18665.1 nucleoside-diphosphate kinase [Egibacter rhizosphaerae]
MSERTLILVKPDAVRRGLTGEVIRRIEAKGFAITRLEQRHISRDIAEQHYAEHADKPFYAGLVDFITSGPLVAMIVEGEGAVAGMRQLMGATNPLEAAPGSIRGDYATSIGENLVHGSDSIDNGEREIGLFFPDA